MYRILSFIFLSFVFLGGAFIWVYNLFDPKGVDNIYKQFEERQEI